MHHVFGDECVAVLGEEVDEIVGAGDVDGEVPFIVGAGVAVEDEKFAHEQTTQVCATRRVQGVSMCHSVRGDAPRTNQSLKTASTSLFFSATLASPYIRAPQKDLVYYGSTGRNPQRRRGVDISGYTGRPCHARYREAFSSVIIPPDLNALR